MLVSSCEEFAGFTGEFLANIELGCTVITFCPAAGNLIEVIEKEQPGMILLDLKINSNLIIETVLTLKQRFPRLYLLLAVEPPALDKPFRSFIHHADDFIVKPVTAPELFVRIKKALQAECNPGVMFCPSGALVEQNYRQIIELVQEGIWVIDAGSRTVYVNAKMAGMLGYTVEEMDGIPVTALIRKSDETRYITAIHRRKEGIAERFDFSFVHKSGRTVFTRLETAPIFGNEGEYLGAVALIVDLTAQKRTGAKLRATRNRLQAVAENILDLFVQVDERGVLEYVSPSCQRVLGFNVEEMSNAVAFDFVHPDDLERVNELFSRMVEGETLDNPEVRLKHADGHYVWTEIVGKSIYDETGLFSFAAFVIRDVTERKNQEKELLKAAQLESIALLAGGIAHDFNNLLAVVLGNVSLAKLCLNKPHQILERLERVEKATLQAKDLSARLIAFAKGDLPEKEIIQPAHLIQEAVYLAVNDFSVRWSLELPDDLHPLKADMGQLVQVFNNILLNAVQAMPDGGVIKIRGENLKAENEMHREDCIIPAGVYVKIAVSDEGAGISPELLPRIFDPFFTTKPEGYGLGLATAHSIVTRHNGRITVELRSGGGTTFNIYLPAFTGEEEMAADDC